MTRAKKSKPKQKWQAAAAEGLRYVFFLFYIAGLLAFVYGARLISHFQQDQEQLREQRMQAVILEKQSRPIPLPVELEPSPEPGGISVLPEATLPEGEHAAV